MPVRFRPSSLVPLLIAALIVMASYARAAVAPDSSFRNLENLAIMIILPMSRRLDHAAICLSTYGNLPRG